MAEGPGSPAAEDRKRKRDESEDEERTKARMSEQHGKVRDGEARSEISRVVASVLSVSVRGCCSAAPSIVHPN